MNNKMNMRPTFLLMAIAVGLVTALGGTKLDSAVAQEIRNQRTSSVGYPARIEQIIIKGSELESIQIEDRDQPFILRVVQSYPHGEDSYRYDFEYIGLDPGKFNLLDYVKRADGTELGNIGEIEVQIESILKPGAIEPNELTGKSASYNHFYIALLILAGALWLVGLLWILFGNRGKVRRPQAVEEKVTVADRLQPLIDQAMAGELGSQEKAELERVLNAFWSRKLRLGHLTADQLRKKLRSHGEASKMLNAIDHWIHRPDSDPNLDVVGLLKPYQSVNYDEL